MSDYSTERLQVLGELEEVVMDMAATRYAAKGETFESLGYQPPTWFQNPISRTDPKTGKRAGDTWPISKVIKWARTTRGGSMDQIELFTDPTGHQGCVRWGMCDTGSEK